MNVNEIKSNANDIKNAILMQKELNDIGKVRGDIVNKWFLTKKYSEREFIMQRELSRESMIKEV
jgi:hypothetical protein